MTNCSPDYSQAYSQAELHFHMLKSLRCVHAIPVLAGGSDIIFFRPKYISFSILIDFSLDILPGRGGVQTHDRL
jgi:hypothetical protein